MMKEKVQKGGKLQAQIQQKHKTNKKEKQKPERMCNVETNVPIKKEKKKFFEGFLGVFGGIFRTLTVGFFEVEVLFHPQYL